MTFIPSSLSPNSSTLNGSAPQPHPPPSASASSSTNATTTTPSLSASVQSVVQQSELSQKSSQITPSQTVAAAPVTQQPQQPAPTNQFQNSQSQVPQSQPQSGVTQPKVVASVNTNTTTTANTTGQTLSNGPKNCYSAAVAKGASTANETSTVTPVKSSSTSSSNNAAQQKKNSSTDVNSNAAPSGKTKFQQQQSHDNYSKSMNKHCDKPRTECKYHAPPLSLNLLGILLFMMKQLELPTDPS